MIKKKFYIMLKTNKVLRIDENSFNLVWNKMTHKWEVDDE